MLWTIKCRECNFSTDDIMEVYKHTESVKHKDFALLRGATVEIDWIHIEMKLERKNPPV